jgi:hypothetical protein
MKFFSTHRIPNIGDIAVRIMYLVYYGNCQENGVKGV